MAGDAKWPLKREQKELLVMLAAMLRRFGTERFLEAPLVRADKKDFPDAWEPTLHGMHQLLYRLCWLAYIDPEIVIVDGRPLRDGHSMLRKSEIEILSCTAGTVTFDLASIGNDDVAGLLSHKIGEAFLDLAPGEPFRTAQRASDEVEGSVAAIFLGLGVLAANSSMYRRHAARIQGRSEYSESEIAHAGGLDIADATLLLAIQDILRDEVQDALSTLHGPQREWIQEWREVLDPHEDELREMLGLDEEREPVPLSRSTQPRTAPEVNEDERKRINRGHEIRRVRHRSVLGVVPGVLVGAIGFALGPIVGGATLVGGAAVAWWRLCRPYFVCAECAKLIGRNDTACPHCGGTITATISEKELQAHWRKLREEEDERDAQLDPSEFAGDPDADVTRSAARSAARARVASRRERATR